MSGSSTRPDNRQAFGFDLSFKPSPFAYRSPSKLDQSDESEAESPHQNWPGKTSTTKSTTTLPSVNPPSATTNNTFNIQPSPTEAQELVGHLALLKAAQGNQDQHELSGTPIFTAPVLQHSKHLISQYGFIAGISEVLENNTSDELSPLAGDLSDPRLFFNISAPSSAFICGSQGSGKSHTLSCFLENCLMKSHVSKLDNPLAGLVLHYDSFSSDLKGSPCEAANLSSNPNIKVRVLCSPTNLQTIQRTYLGMNVQIEPLRINQSDLNTKRMMDLMAVSQDDGRIPLYLHAVNRILREMRMIQQQTNVTFNYAEFKRQVAATAMTPAQLAPLTQRLDTLESFMPKSQTEEMPKTNLKSETGNSWIIQPGSLTIVDLSCPCVTAEAACALFSMCLSLFLEQKTVVGRVVALDEAHKYMNEGSEATALTNTLLSSIRLQRHLGTRVFISTQEPTISPKLLDLCSFTIVHRFSSPDWLRCLKSHLAALDIEEDSVDTQKTKIINVFNQIVKLRVGEALLFAPSATIGIERSPERHSGFVPPKMNRLSLGYMKIRIRGRITTDGGKSVMATGTSTIPVKLNTVKPSPTISKTPVVPTTTLASVPVAQLQLTAPSTSTFGVPSPTPRIFDGLRNSAPMTSAVTDLETQGMLGFGHTPPVTRKVNVPSDIKMPETEKLVHGTANKNIFGDLNPGNSAQGPMTTIPGGLKQENIPFRQAESAENPVPKKAKDLASSIYASPKSAPAQTLNSISTNPAPMKSPYSAVLSATSCSGTWGSVFTPHFEREPNNTSMSSFQHICFSEKFSGYSQEELRLTDYAIFVCQMKDTLLSEYR